MSESLCLWFTYVQHHCATFVHKLLDCFQCLVTLWQLLDDWMVLLDSDNDKAETSTSVQHTQLNNDHNNTHPTPSSTKTAIAAESTVSAGTDAESLKQTLTEMETDSPTTAISTLSKSFGEECTMQTELVCPGDDSSVISSVSKTRNGDLHERSPAIPRICALIQAFYLCTQNSKGKK